MCLLQVFGPVLAVATFATEEEAVAIANDSEYGLGAAVICSDKQARMLHLPGRRAAGCKDQCSALQSHATALAHAICQ